ncbi:hypothetical protein MMC31_002254 [Peltigera leucophlebia]|nr:hypothetical protein [Peltigera leucophlebia]
MASSLKVGDNFPEGVEFSYIPYSKEKEDIKTCGTPTTYDASKEFADKKVVLFSVPGAFTPGCSVRHLPGYIKNLSAIKGKGVDIVAVISYNDAFVLSAWSKANGVKGDDILFLSDGGAGFSSKHGWTRGERTGRYALIIDHGKVVYAENEPGSDVTQASAQASETATEDQALNHSHQNRIQRSEFELNITEEPPTSDQLRSILEYVGGSRAKDVVEGARNEADAIKILAQDPSKFRAPVTVDWSNGRAVIGEGESEIIKMINQLPR